MGRGLQEDHLMVIVIAEIGINHCGRMDLACELIHAAATTGANIVKTQTYDADTLDPPGPRRDMLKSLQFSYEQFECLKEYADKQGIEFLSTPFDVGSLKFLVELGVKRIKIASGHLDNWPLLKAAGETGLPVLLSSGMATWGQVAAASREIKLENVTVMHCVSSYPCRVEDATLMALRGVSYDVGYSDHTTTLILPAVAVAMGATVIEKHLTLDSRMEGPDHRTSLEPHQFRIMVENIREVEKALGDGVKQPQACEAEAMKIADERRQWRAG